MTAPGFLFNDSPYLRRYSRLTQQQLSSIDDFLQQQLDSPTDRIHKTHFFNGRYENIYMKRDSHPELQLLISEAVENAADILQMNSNELSVGFWFNLMPPGHDTTLHTHEDLDELLSGVIYLTVPENSGNLILFKDEQQIELEPVAGNYLFFDPATPHSVSVNHSNQSRLSIGMNFGLTKDRADCFASF